MMRLKFIYPVCSILEGYPGTDPGQQVIKRGPCDPDIWQEVAVIQVQLLKKVVEFPKLCVPLED